MTFGIKTTSKKFRNLIISRIRELIKPVTTNFLSAGTLRMGTVIKKSSKPLENFEAHHHPKYDGDDVIFTG